MRTKYIIGLALMICTQGFSQDILNYNPTSIFLGYGTGNTGSFNYFIGSKSGESNVTGSQNFFGGAYSGRSNQTGWANVFIGSSAGYSNVSGNYNTFLGEHAGRNIPSGADNTAVGSYAAKNAGLGNQNTFVGTRAGLNSQGDQNTFLGSFSGSNNKGSRNIFVGTSAGSKSVATYDNVFVGYRVANEKKLGNDNVFVGAYTGDKNLEGEKNVFIGKYAGFENNGSRNVFLGYHSGSQFASESDILSIANNPEPLIYGNFKKAHVSIGKIASVDLQNDFTLFVNGHAFATGYWKSSDKKFKKDIKPIYSALEKVSKIDGREYLYKASDTRNFPEGNQIGFIAQDLRKILPEAVLEHDDGTLSVDYTTVIPVLVEAIKELDKKHADNAAIEDRLAMMQSQIDQLTELLKDEGSDHSQSLLQGNILQNVPNPGKGNTKILYNLDNEKGAVEIKIFNLEGKQIKSFQGLSPQGSLEVTSQEIGQGLFHYAIIVNGEIRSTKKMILE